MGSHRVDYVTGRLDPTILSSTTSTTTRLCRNDKRVHDLTDWVKEALFGSLDVGRGRFIMVGNLISKNSVLFNIAHTRGVYLSKVTAVDKNGEPVWRDKWTKEEAQAYRDFVGYRAWEKEMMHNPIIDGTIFRNEWIRFKRLPALRKYDQARVLHRPFIQVHHSQRL